jgi:hypothetical protein
MERTTTTLALLFVALVISRTPATRIRLGRIMASMKDR